MLRSATFVVVLCCVAWMPSQAQEKIQVPPDSLIAGVSQLELSQRWWQWAFSFERVRSPIADRTGQMCASRQSGDVWFLAGTYGTARVVRTCHVPQGKFLFFPLINYVTFRGENSEEPCSSLIEDAARLTDSPSALILEVDGKQAKDLQLHRLAGKTCFSLVPGEPADAAGNGYYVALAPLAKGVHVINFGGILSSMSQAVTYRIVVE